MESGRWIKQIFRGNSRWPGTMNGGIGKRERWIRNLNRVFEWNIKLNGKLGGLRYSHSASSRAFKRSLRLLLLLLHSETSLEKRSFFTDIDFSIRTADL